MADFAAAREKMVQRQIAARGIADPRIQEAFRAVPRELFVPLIGAHGWDETYKGPDPCFGR